MRDLEPAIASSILHVDRSPRIPNAKSTAGLKCPRNLTTAHDLKSVGARPDTDVKICRLCIVQEEQNQMR